MAQLANQFNESDDPQTYGIIGAAMAVHRELGDGFLEAVYQEALEVEFKLRNIPYTREHQLPVQFKEKTLKTGYRVDFYCYDSIPVELKAIETLTNRESAIAINYLKACHQEKGLLINFGTPSLQFKRFINSIR